MENYTVQIYGDFLTARIIKTNNLDDVHKIRKSGRRAVIIDSQKDQITFRGRFGDCLKNGDEWR